MATEWHSQPARQKPSRLPYWRPTVTTALSRRSMTVRVSLAVMTILVLSVMCKLACNEQTQHTEHTEQRMLLDAFEPLLEANGAAHKVEIVIDAKHVLALQDRHTSSTRGSRLGALEKAKEAKAKAKAVRDDVKTAFDKQFKKNERFAVVKVERGDCHDEKCMMLDPKGCRNRCLWNKKKFSSAKDPQQHDGSFLYWMDTSTAKVDADKLLLCAEFSPTYHVRFARTYSLEEVVARGGEADGAMAGRNRVRNECRFFAGPAGDELEYVDEHESNWRLTDHDMAGINGAAPGILMIMDGVDAETTMDAIKMDGRKDILKASAKVAAFAAGGIAIGLLTGGASVATSGTYFLSQVAKGTAEGMWANEVERQMSSAGKNKMASQRYAALPPEIELSTQNIYVRKMGSILEDNKVTCVFVPGPPGPRCLAFDEENKPLQMFKDTSAGECYNGEQPCTFARVMEMTEGGATARIVHGTQELCRSPQRNNVADLLSTAMAKKHPQQCVWDILIGSGGRVFVARKADDGQWLLPYTDTQSQKAVSAKQLQSNMKEFLLSAKFDALLYEQETDFGTFAHNAVKEAGKMELAMTDD